MSGKFYVYEHWRPDTGQCFYVGKGHARRAWDMYRGRNRWHKFVCAKLKDAGLQVDVRVISEHMTEKEAFSLEVERIAYWRSLGTKLVNLSNGGEGPAGFKHTDEWKLAVSRKLRGRKLSQAHIAKIVAFHTGKKWALGIKRPRELVDRLAALNRGKRREPEVVARLRAIRLSNPTFKGKTHTQEWRERMRALQVGIPKSEETKARMRKPKSEMHKQKLREINLGKTHSAEARARLAAIAKADWARRQAKMAAEAHQQSLAL